MNEIVSYIGSVIFLLVFTAFTIFWIWIHIFGGSMIYETEGLIPKIKRYRGEWDDR